MSSDILSTLPIQKPDMALPKKEPKNDAELRKAAKEFESMFMNLVMQKMRETVPDSDLWGEGSQKIKFFESMLDEEYSKMSAGRSSNGLADVIYKHLSRRLASMEGTPNEN